MAHWTSLHRGCSETEPCPAISAGEPPGSPTSESFAAAPRSHFPLNYLCARVCPCVCARGRGSGIGRWFHNWVCLLDKLLNFSRPQCPHQRVNSTAPMFPPALNLLDATEHMFLRHPGLPTPPSPVIPEPSRPEKSFCSPQPSTNPRIVRPPED